MSEHTQNKNSQPNPHEMLDAGSELLRHFKVEIDPVIEPEQFLEAISQLDPRFAGGRDLVRYQLEEDQTKWPDETKSVIMDAAERMRMLEKETSLVGDFNIVIALGGARQAPLDRAQYVAHAVTTNMAQVHQLVIAGSSRELKDAEKENASNYAPGASTEYDLCAGAAGKIFKTHYDELPTRSLRAGGEKANTAEIVRNTLDYLIETKELPQNARIAAVTTQIYQASTALDLARVAKEYDVAEAFTAGNPSDPRIIEARTPATYLTEVLRTLRAGTLAIWAEKREEDRIKFGL